MNEVYLTSPVVGGFGNQLFIIAAAFGVKNLFLDQEVRLLFLKTAGTSLRPTYWNSFFAICPGVLDTLVEKLPKGPVAKCGDYSCSDGYRDLTATVEQNRQKGISTSYEGYFQNWRYLPPSQFLLDLFNVPGRQRRMKEELALDFNVETTCSLHFRLGDYKRLAHIHPILPDIYYRNAIRTVLRLNPQITTLLVFNELEDQTTVENRLMMIVDDDSHCEVKFVNKLGANLQDWQEVILMSLCKANIIANSSFSWWGAYFNNQSTATVVYPPQWSCGEKNPPEFSLALRGWIKGSLNHPMSDSAVIYDDESVCIDVGSHDGVDALRLQRSYLTKVYAFEPHPKFFGLTSRNLSHNTSIEVLPYAVSDSSAKFITLNESQGDQSHSILPFKSTEELNIAWAGCFAVHPSGRSFVVRLTRLDSFLTSRGYSPSSLSIPHLHVDAQGVDLEVLKSLGDYLQCIQTGVVEVAKTAATSSYQGQQGTIASVTEFLESNGFSIDAVKPNDVTPEISREFNICFSRRKEK